MTVCSGLKNCGRTNKNGRLTSKNRGLSSEKLLNYLQIRRKHHNIHVTKLNVWVSGNVLSIPPKYNIE